MLQHSIDPDVPSNEFDAIEDFASRVIRHALHQSPLLQHDEVLTHPTVTAMLDYIGQRLLAVFDHPRTHCDEHIRNEYAHMERWSRDEAVSLCAGMDPLYHTIKPHFYNPAWRNRREHVDTRLLQAISDRQLPCAVEGAHFTLDPTDVCHWALANHLADESVVDFFSQIKSLRPERIFDADPLRAFTTINPHG